MTFFADTDNTSTITICDECGEEYDISYEEVCPNSFTSYCGCINTHTDDGYLIDSGICEQCGYCCDDHCECFKARLEPQWEYWKPTYDEELFAESMHLARRYYENLVDPASMMASFYLMETILLHGPTVPDLYAKAKAIQDSIIETCDIAFRLYGFAAIGGELRHHQNVARAFPEPGNRWESMGRSGSGAAFYLIGHKHGWCEALEWAEELFMDTGGFPDSDGYGGPAWAACTNVLRNRLCNVLDPKTFVDRCFALQHNGGSFLNKGHWRPHTSSWRRPERGPEDLAYLADECQDVGEAHHANPTDLYTLMDYAVPEHGGLFRSWVKAHNRAQRSLCRPMFRIPDRRKESPSSGTSYWREPEYKIFSHGVFVGEHDIKYIHTDNYWLLNFDPEKALKPGDYMPAPQRFAELRSKFEHGQLFVRMASMSTSGIGDVYMYDKNEERFLPMSNPGLSVKPTNSMSLVPAVPATPRFHSEFHDIYWRLGNCPDYSLLRQELYRLFTSQLHNESEATNDLF